MQDRRLSAGAYLLLACGLCGCAGDFGSGDPVAGAPGGPPSLGEGGASGRAGGPPPSPGGNGGGADSGGSPPSAGGVGSGSSGTGPGPGSPECATPEVGPERIQRLTPREYKNSLRALLSNDALEPVLDADREPLTTLDAVRKWYNAADVAVPSTLSWLASAGSCDPSDDEACAAQLYQRFAERAFRRPLQD